MIKNKDSLKIHGYKEFYVFFILNVLNKNKWEYNNQDFINSRSII